MREACREHGHTMQAIADHAGLHHSTVSRLIKEGDENARNKTWPLFFEGGPVSKALNLVPGVNATSGFHDVLQISMDEPMRSILNVPGMIPAAALTTGAVISTVPIPVFDHLLR